MTKEQNFQEFMSRMDANIGYKSVILPTLPRGWVNILDVGGGTGVLSHQMKLSNPMAKITLLDSDEQMLKRAKENNTADLYVDNWDSLPYETYDAIVFCSVLHEVGDWEDVLISFTPKLKPGGKIIIRDGYREYTNSILKLKLKNPKDAQLFYEACRGSIIGGLRLKFEDEYIIGNTNDVRSFLQTYTWGWDSLHREQHENHLFANPHAIYDFFTAIEDYDMSTFKVTRICQQNYFNHLNKLVEIKEMWNTHVLIEINKNKRRSE